MWRFLWSSQSESGWDPIPICSVENKLIYYNIVIEYLKYSEKCSNKWSHNIDFCLINLKVNYQLDEYYEW